MLITCVILMMIDVVMHGQGRATRRTTRFLPIKLLSAILHLFWGCCFGDGGATFSWFTITWSFMVQRLKIFTDTYTSRIVRGQSTLKDLLSGIFGTD